MEKKRNLLIFGTGAIAEIASFYFQNDSSFEVIGFVEIAEFMSKSSRSMYKPLVEWSVVKKKFHPEEVYMFVAIGYRKTNSVRQTRYEEVKAAGYDCASYISTQATVFTETIGENCFILEGNTLQPFTQIGNNVTMWSGNHLGHHSVVEDNVFIASHAVISGKCRIGANSFLGVNCCLHDGVVIGERSVVGAGVIVTESCETRSVFIPQKMEPRVVKRNVI
uniref:Sugar O-acyltransferase, sialic acid O-acetyltransferase NeuD family n=1 Tax=Candidatus Kentrum sp. LFY TaxID=2126342 RepID=A0A450UPI5_9GAMM|nr:MAG: sugar O-acyltransferase, sialic acid O-acetyltransferase NeuD family [Candidatus Kentron sp. LFY]